MKRGSNSGPGNTFAIPRKNLNKISHIDFYESASSADDNKSLTFRFSFYSEKNLFTDESVDTSINLILNKVSSYFNIGTRSIL